MEENIKTEKQEPASSYIPEQTPPVSDVPNTKTKPRAHLLKAVIIAILIVAGIAVAVLALPSTRYYVLDQTGMATGRCLTNGTCISVGSCGQQNPEGPITGCFSTSSHKEWKDPILKSQYKEISQEKAQQCASDFISKNPNNANAQDYLGKGKSISSNSNIPTARGFVAEIDASSVNSKDTYLWHFNKAGTKYYVGAQTCTVYPVVPSGPFGATVPIDNLITYSMPSGWKKEELTVNFAASLISPDTSKDALGYMKTGARISMNVYQNIHGKTLEEQAKEDNVLDKNAVVSPIKIAGEDGLYSFHTFNGQSKNFYAPAGNYILHFSFECTSCTDKSSYDTGIYANDFNAFINSIKFKTGQNQITDTSNWKTYTGQTAYTSDGSSNFSIKYPGNWLLEENKLYPSGKNTEGGFIILGAGGHGAPEPEGTKTYPGGTAKYYLKPSEAEVIDGYVTFNINKIDYIFEVRNFPESLEPTLQQILSTFNNPAEFEIRN